jgi:predicted AAA+ superfamily ATPase
MPSLLTIKDNPILFHNNAKSIISSILLRDLIPFFNIKNSVLLEKLIGYIFSNIGNMFSANNIKEYFINNKIYKTISQNTVEKYLNYLVDGFILCKCLRYDIRGKKKLKTLYKMYVTDTGLKNSYLEQRTYTNIGDNIENVVYIELLRRGYSVYYGTFQYKDNVKKTTVIKEIDFVCINNEEIWYIQVADNISSQSVMERELSPFSSIKDGYKLLLNNSGVNTMIDGVKIMDVQK